MENQETKQCKMCYQSIDSRAKKCPHCHHWQNKWSLHNPMLIVAILVAFWLATSALLNRGFGPGVDFESYKEHVAVDSTEFKFGESNCGPTLVILGKIANETDITWRDIHVEVQFFDKYGKLIDTDQESMYSFLLPAKATTDFKWSGKRYFPKGNYATHTVKLLKAKESKFPF